MADYILTEKEEGVLRITLNRPEKYNSFIREMALELQEVLSEAHHKASVRCVLLTGAGRAFCAGQDLAEATDPEGPALTKIVSEHYNPLLLKLRALPKPVVAAVNGVAAGAGANLALACDVVVATESASFIQAFSKIGLIPDSGGTYTLPRLVGMQRASALMMLGDKVSAQDALAMGMLYRVYPDTEFADKASEIAHKLAQMPTLALARTKELLNRSFENNLVQQLEAEDIFQTECGESYDYQEGTRAFLEKRRPTFKGR